MNTKPFLYQKQDAAQIGRFGGRALLAGEMGTGKTLTSLLWAYRNPETRPIIIICPASLKWNWQRECSLHFGWNAEVLDGTKPEQQLLVTPSIVVINYDILGPVKGQKSKRGIGWLKFLRDLKPKLVILDECHYLGNFRTARFKHVKTICKGVPNIIALSGTPLTNRPAELWPTLHLLQPIKFKKFWTFAHSYCSPKMTQYGWDFRGASNMDKLHGILTKTLMIRRKKADVLPFLPEKSRTLVPISMGAKGNTEYKKASKDFIGWLKTKSLAKAKKARRALAMVRIGYLKRLAFAGKIKGVFEWIDNFLQDSEEKLILFAVHKIVVKHLQERYKDICVVVNGDVTGRDRQRAVDQFQHNLKTKLFIGNIKAAGVGLTLTAASVVAFVELGWTPGEHTQAEDRAHRIGQKSHTQIYYLVAKDTIEERICKLLQEKQGVLSEVLDGKKTDTTYSSLNLFDLLMKELEKETNNK